MISVFLQVRVDSTRLPGKALAMLGGKTVIERCFEALAAVRADRRVLVTEPASVSALEPLARAAGWETYVGSKDDVLDRFVQAARATGTTTIVRATGDNPLVSAALANSLRHLHEADQADYSGFVGGPVGTGVEILRVAALEAAWSLSPNDYQREHVGPALYQRPEHFRIHRPEVPADCRAPQARVTLDTPEDLEYLTALWDELDPATPPEVEDLIPWLNHHPR